MVKISGGDRLEARLAEIAKNVAKASSVEIGFLQGATYPDGTSVPLVAAMNEFGNEASPPRPFFRGMVADKSPEWPDAVGKILVATNYDGEATLSRTGAAIQGQLQDAIATFVGAPLSEKTIARKGHSKQLIDTGHMMRSVDFSVK